MWQIAPVWRPFVSFGPLPISQTRLLFGGIYKFFFESRPSSRRSVLFRRSRHKNNILILRWDVVLMFQTCQRGGPLNRIEKSIGTQECIMYIIIYYMDTRWVAGPPWGEEGYVSSLWPWCQGKYCINKQLTVFYINIWYEKNYS